MPVEFLTDEQAAAYAAFRGAPSRSELERFFFLDDADRELIEGKRRAHNRLGFALQLTTARYLGVFVDDPMDVPVEVVDYLAEQLGIEDASVLKAYGERENTRLEQFHRMLRRREVFAKKSSKWGDPRAKLLASQAWEQAKPTVLASLGLPAGAGEHLAARAALLDGTYREVASRLPDNAQIVFDDDGRLHFAALEPEPEPSSLLDLRAAVNAMLPRVDLPEVLLKVFSWTGADQAFTSVTGGEARLKDLHVTIAALLVADGCNVGYTPVIGGVDALKYGRLSHVDQTYLRLATYRAANATLIQSQASIPLAQAWGGGLVASVDGMRFVVPVPSVYARPDPKYFGRRGGATWLNMINDQAAGLGGKVMAGTPRDSLYVLDVLYDRDGGKRPEMIVTDTASYSDIVFGLLTLAGFAYAPQLADLPDQKMWRIDRTADYGAFTDAARGRVDLARIERHWEDILRIIGSIHTGAVRAYDVIRMLSRDGRPTPLGDAIAHYGRIAKTPHGGAPLSPGPRS
nr:Tn3 family transposase [Streptomyces sp. ISL-100]